VTVRDGDVLTAVPVSVSKRRGVPYVVPAGYTHHPCFRCREPLWIGPLTRVAVSDGRAVYCMECLVGMYGIDVLQAAEHRTLDGSVLPSG
jgi:hypothetical protein